MGDGYGSPTYTSLPPGMRERGAVVHQRLIIWFPNGDAEFYAGVDVPSVGDRIRRNNSDWIVARVESHVDKTVRVTVRPSEVVRDDSWPAPYQFIGR